MAKKKTIIEETIPDGAIPGITEGEFDFGGDSDGDLILEKFKSQFSNSRVFIKVFKIVAGHQPIFQFKSEEAVDEETLQTYGGGKYVLRFFVDGMLKHTETLEVADKPTATGATAQPTTAHDMQIAMMKEQSTFNRDLLMALLGRQTPISAPTPMSELAHMMGIVQGIPAQGNGFEKLIDIFQKGIDLGKTATGGSEMDWKTTLISTAKELAPALLSVASRGAVPVNVTGEPANGNGIGNHIGPTTPDSLLKYGLSLLKPKILSGLPVGLALDWIVANANDPQYQGFLSVALSKEFQDLAQADPEVANEPYNTWLRQFLAGIKEHFKSVTENDESADEAS